MYGGIMEEKKIFNALSDDNRLKIINIIKDNEVCGCDILDKLSITQPTLTYHMKILIDADLVTFTKRGTWSIYKLKKETFNKITNYISDFNINKGDK
jgi:ArsR family transcriptional regulator, arsenate/arsenite/antimonite-responsive transcriptional repressor